MTSCNGETSNQSNQKVNYEKAMNQALSEIFENLREIKQDTKRQRDKLLLERRRGSAPSSVLRKTTTTLQLPKHELSKSTSNMLWVLHCEEEEDASWMTGGISLNFEFQDIVEFDFELLVLDQAVLVISGGNRERSIIVRRPSQFRATRIFEGLTPNYSNRRHWSQISWMVRWLMSLPNTFCFVSLEKDMTAKCGLIIWSVYSRKTLVGGTNK